MKPEPNEGSEEAAESDEEEMPGAWLFGMFADLGFLGPEPPSTEPAEDEGKPGKS